MKPRVWVWVGSGDMRAFEGHLHAATLREVIRYLYTQDHHVLKRVGNEEGELPRFVLTCVNEDDARTLNGADTLLQERNEIRFILAIPNG